MRSVTYPKTSPPTKMPTSAEAPISRVSTLPRPSGASAWVSATPMMLST
jgi:hypothetical protein